MASLTISNLCKHYDSVLALADVSFNVDDGEFLVLVGPSGCGKSSLLRMVAGLEAMESGRILMDGADISRTDPKDRDIAMVFQNYALYPHMTVFENMAFGLQQRKTPKTEIHRRVLETAKTLELEQLINRKPGALSGGQRQRVAMGRAIIRNPAIFLLDEPLSNLDAKLRVHMRSELKMLRSRLGVTTLYVTHDQTEAMTLGDRVAVLKPVSSLDETNLQQIDLPRNLYLWPRNIFVAGFIGSPAMNFLYVDIESDRAGLTARIADSESTLRLPAGKYGHLSELAKYNGQRIVMGVRPEFFSIADNGQSQNSGTVRAKILVSELVGPDAFLHFDLKTPRVDLEDIATLRNDGGVDTGRARLTARLEAASLPEFVDTLDLTINCANIHFFDSETCLVIE